MGSGDKVNKIRIVWDYEEGHRVLPSSGIIGGITTGGHLRASFYNELGVMPDQLKTVAIKEKDENAIERSRNQDEAHATRRIAVTLLVPLEKLRSFGEWFNDRADEYDALHKQAVEEAARQVEQQGKG